MKIRINYFIISAITLFMASFLSSCSNNEPLPSKSALIAAYNDFARISPPTLGEGDYPLTANFSREDKGKESLAKALVKIGFIEQESSKSDSKLSSEKDDVKTYNLTARGKEAYDLRAHGFVWGYHNATNITRITGPTRKDGTDFLYVSFKTRIINIPEWAKTPIILDNYPIVKASIQKNEFTFHTTFKLVGKTWTMIEVVN